MTVQLSCEPQRNSRKDRLTITTAIVARALEWDTVGKRGPYGSLRRGNQVIACQSIAHFRGMSFDFGKLSVQGSTHKQESRRFKEEARRRLISIPNARCQGLSCGDGKRAMRGRSALGRGDRRKEREVKSFD